MGYEIHIERESSPLSLEEWSQVVDATPGVRLAYSGVSITNPTTHEVITMPRAEGDAEAELDGEWLPCFRWSSSGSVSFRAPKDFQSPDCVIRQLASQLAQQLSASLVGDDGELYF